MKCIKNAVLFYYWEIFPFKIYFEQKIENILSNTLITNALKTK